MPFRATHCQIYKRIYVNLFGPMFFSKCRYQQVLLSTNQEKVQYPNLLYGKQTVLPTTAFHGKGKSSRKMGVLGHYDSFWTTFPKIKEKNINFLRKIKIKNLSFS